MNIERGANLGWGDIEIGNNSGLGTNCIISKAKIGNDVMMGPNVLYIPSSHRFDRNDIPMIEQGFDQVKRLVIEDDVWIGANVIFLPGIVDGKGAIIGAGSVVTRNVPEYDIVAGNPARIIRSRLYAQQPDSSTSNTSAGSPVPFNCP